MKICTSYSIRIASKCRVPFEDSVRIYRKAVDYIIGVCLERWDEIKPLKVLERKTFVENLIHRTSDNPEPTYKGFDEEFYKFPGYYRRAAIAEAIGAVSSYRSRLATWEGLPKDERGRMPGLPKAGFACPALYRNGSYVADLDKCEARIKVWTHNTWDWITVNLRKGDADYVKRRCKNRKMLSPVFRKRGKVWSLDFSFEEKVELHDTDIFEQTIIAVDLGINSSCVCTAMRADGTVLGRHFQSLTREYDSLSHAVNRIKKAQQHGARKMPRLWARAKGINNGISVKTASFIMGLAVLYNADTIVFEHLDLQGKKRGSKKQRLHLWRAKYVQAMVTDKAHRAGMRISRINAWGTSRLAYDGSGRVKRGRESEKTGGNYSLCEFTTGKMYNCDLNASYNIGSRYFVREIIKSLPAKTGSALKAKVPSVAKRSTCTLSTLITLNTELASLMEAGSAAVA